MRLDHGSSSPFPDVDILLIHGQESPHEHQQSLLLSRIITNVVSRAVKQQGDLNRNITAFASQEKLNESVMVMNKQLQVRHEEESTLAVMLSAHILLGHQYSEHEY
jgi:hypothetical protein